MIRIDAILDVQAHLSELDAVVFDMDDTLYSEKDYVRSGYRAVAAAFPEISRMEEKLWQAFLAKKQAINEVLLEEGLFSEENLKKSLEVYRNHLPDISLYPGVLEMLQRLKASGKSWG